MLAVICYKLCFTNCELLVACYGMCAASYEQLIFLLLVACGQFLAANHMVHVGIYFASHVQPNMSLQPCVSTRVLNHVLPLTFRIPGLFPGWRILGASSQHARQNSVAQTEIPPRIRTF